MAHRPSPEDLRAPLERLARTYDRRFLDSDPVGVVRRFPDPADREIVAFLAAGLAYGRVESIRRSVGRLADAMDGAPSAFVAGMEPRRAAARLSGFAHRFTRGRDVALWLWLLRQARETAGSLEGFFAAGDADPTAPTLEGAMDAFGRRLFDLDPRPFHPRGDVPAGSGARWLLPLPRNGSAAKRHCLLLRWLVRADDGVDCGLWRTVSPSRLVVPLDVHLQRVSAALGWTRRRTPGWAMALEVTDRLRELDPADPTRFDFALCRLGILGRVRARRGRLARRHLLSVLAAAGSEEALV